MLEPGSPQPYLFSIAGNIAFAAAYACLSFIHLLRYMLEARILHREDHVLLNSHKWTLCLPVAEAFMFLGFILRLVCRSNQQSIPLYAVSNLFIILSPTAFIAFIYMMYGRLIACLDPTLSTKPECKGKSMLSPVLPPRLAGRLFITSDIITFVIQASGGGLQASGNPDMASLGNKLFLIGVTLQAISFAFFIVLLVMAHIRIANQVQYFTFSTIFNFSKSSVSRTFVALYLACTMIMIRSIFRIVEMAGGYEGSVYHTEVYLFLLDSLPLAIANSSWVLLWPPTVFRKLSRHSQLPNAFDLAHKSIHDKEMR